MSPVIEAFLKLLPVLLGNIPAFINLWNQVKGGLAASDQGAVDAILAVLEPQLDADLARLKADASQLDATL